MQKKYYAILIVFILFVIFTVQNYRVMEVQFLFWKVTTSRGIVIFLSFVTGLIAGLCLNYLKKR